MSNTFFVSLSNFHNSRWPSIACVYRNHHSTLTLCTVLMNLGSNSRFSMMLDSLSMVPLTSKVHIKVICQDHRHFGTNVQQNIFLIHTMSNLQHSHFTCRSNGRIVCLQVCAWEVSGETETFPKSAWWSETAQHHWCQHSVWWPLHVDLQEQLDANENL